MASGATLTVAAGLPVLLQPGVTLTDNGTLTFASGDTVTLSSYYSTEQIVVGSGGVLNASGSTFSASGGSGLITVNGGGQLTANNSTFASSLSQVIVNSGGNLQASNSTFSLNNMTLSPGSFDSLQSNVFATQLSINNGATISIHLNDFSSANATVMASGNDPTDTIDLRKNFWGTSNTTDSAPILAKITDQHTNPMLPTVNFSNWLTNNLQVSSFTPTATGFTAIFSNPFVPGDITLYGSSASTVADVTLVGASSGLITGTLLLDSTDTMITFKATEIGVANVLPTSIGLPILPNDTYTVTFVTQSGPNGFQTAFGLPLVNSHGVPSNITETFKVTNSNKEVFSVPDFARGPDGADNINIPNNTGAGIPITLDNAANATDTMFTMTYNPALLDVTGAAPDASDPGSSFTMTGGGSSGTAVFTFHNGTAQNGPVILGDIIASVPDAAAGKYKAKELLTLSSVTVTSHFS